MRKTFRLLAASMLAGTGIGLVGHAVVGRAKADTWDKMTYVTMNEKMIVGDKVLEPGTYVWKLLDSQSDRHIVQIFNKDQSHLEQTVLAIPNYRLQPTGNTRFAFWETPTGVPKAVRAWFYPGDSFGQEFKYPKKMVAQLASAVRVAVPENYRESEPAPAPVEHTAEPEPQPAPAQPAVEPAPQPAAPVATEPAPAQQAPAAVEPAALPHTASTLPLIGLLGLSSLALAGVLSLHAKRS